MRHTYYFLVLSLLILIAPNLTLALGEDPFMRNGGDSDITVNYRQYKDIPQSNIVVPTVVEVPFDGRNLNIFNFLVYDLTDQTFESVAILEKFFEQKISQKIDTFPSIGLMLSQRMNDGDLSTYADFLLRGNSPSEVTLSISGQKPFTSSSFNLNLADNVYKPTAVEISIGTPSGDRVILAKSAVTGNTIYFPESSAIFWKVKLWYSQPLRITEVSFNQEGLDKVALGSVRFLAQPKHDYRIFFDPDISITHQNLIAYNLNQTPNPLVINPHVAIPNTSYKPSDRDGDGVFDRNDNCPNTVNLDQADIDGSGVGDVCEDFDKDNIANSMDNCPNEPNPNQSDKDGDKIGDVCDGEESRLTEKYPFLPWFGIGFAGMVLIGLLVLAVMPGVKVVPPTEPPIEPKI